MRRITSKTACIPHHFFLLNFGVATFFNLYHFFSAHTFTLISFIDKYLFLSEQYLKLMVGLISVEGKDLLRMLQIQAIILLLDARPGSRQNHSQLNSLKLVLSVVGNLPCDYIIATMHIQLFTVTTRGEQYMET